MFMEHLDNMDQPLPVVPSIAPPDAGKTSALRSMNGRGMVLLLIYRGLYLQLTRTDR